VVGSVADANPVSPGHATENGSTEGGDDTVVAVVTSEVAMEVMVV
jgi:hypothetical protein